VDPDYASLYVCDVDCEVAGKDQKNPTKITHQSFATVIVRMTPKPRPTDDAVPKTKSSKIHEDIEEGDDEAALSLKSAATPTNNPDGKVKVTDKKDAESKKAKSKTTSSRRNLAGDCSIGCLTFNGILP
jgi:hypothetical protein